MLKDPLGILTTENASSTPVKEEARWDAAPTGKCPVCEVPMQVATANGISSYVCLEHRICLPKESESL